MFYKRFTFLIIVRILLIVGNVLLLATIFGDQRLFFNQLILAAVLCLQVAEMIRFVNHTNRELTKLFYAIKHSDFSITFKNQMYGQSFKVLSESMSEIIHAYKQVKIEKEAQYHFLQLLVKQLHIGIIAIENNEKITLINPTAERMMGVEGVKNWKLVEQLNPRFSKEIEQLGDNGKRLIELRTTDETTFTSVSVNTMVLLNTPVTLITLQNINSEIEQKEIEAWHKLIRILTHEIMNSVTPISSLTETMSAFLQNSDGSEKQLSELKQETISDIRFSLNTIQKRTDGLLNFVENYRKLTRVPKPTLSRTNLKSFIASVVKLFEQELTKKNISLEMKIDEALEIEIDAAMIEQVLINIITNAIHALEKQDTPTIAINTSRGEKNIVIEIKDNGSGIAAKNLSEIFIPFFTTKINGSGIGLSLSKQMMAVHGGTIRVKSQIDVGTSFFLYFNR